MRGSRRSPAADLSASAYAHRPVLACCPCHRGPRAQVHEQSKFQHHSKQANRHLSAGPGLAGRIRPAETAATEQSGGELLEAGAPALVFAVHAREVSAAGGEGTLMPEDARPGRAAIFMYAGRSRKLLGCRACCSSAGVPARLPSPAVVGSGGFACILKTEYHLGLGIELLSAAAMRCRMWFSGAQAACAR